MIDFDENTSTYSNWENTTLNMDKLREAMALINTTEPFAEFMKEYGVNPEEYIMILPQSIEHIVTDGFKLNVPNYVKFHIEVSNIVFLRVRTKPRVNWRPFEYLYIDVRKNPISVMGDCAV